MKSFWQALKKPYTVLAPMEGVTDYVFREIISEVGKPDVLFTEFISSEGLFSRGHENTVRRFEKSEKQHPIIAQIWGTNPNTFYKCAKYVQQAGFDGIDVNMGCPDTNVMKRGSGAALIKNENLATDLIQALRDGAGNISVSVKTRIGIDEIVTEKWIEFLLKQNIDALTIHLRTAEEKSRVDAHWEEMDKIIKIRNNFSPTTQIIGNGDITSIQQVEEMHRKYNVDGVMIGRGIFMNPYLFDTSGKKHTPKEYLELLLKHTKRFVDYYGDKRNFDDMKKFFKVYVREFVGATDLKIKLMETHTYSEIEDIVLKFINEKHLR